MRQARATGSSIAAVAVITAAVYALRPFAPVLSLGVLYLLAVLPVSARFGLAYGVPVAVASQLVFNFLFLPPLHTLALRDTENWVALGVYVVTAVVVSRLSTGLIAAARVRRSDAIKTAVLHAVSHDLRSPLTAIRAASEGLASTALSSAERATLIDTVRSETSRLDRVVGNLLDLSRLEVGAAAPQAELWPADMLAARALDQLGAAAARVEVGVPAQLPPVTVDAAQIDRVLVNLLENALRFTAEPQPVELSATAANGEVVFRVVDRGPGVAESDRSRIFEPFERGAGGRGSGLGLAIARGFADANGSRLWVEAAPGGGAAFLLALPIEATT